MADKKKAREVTDPNEAFARLGYSGAVTDPEGNPVTTEPEQQAQPSEQVQPQPQADTSDNAIEFDEEPEQEQEQPKPEQQQVPPEEQQRRSWQAEADRAKSEAQKAQEQIRLLQAQNQQLMGVVTPFMQKYGMQPQQTQTPQQNGEVEPEPDFIEDGYFEPKKFADYQRKRDAWLQNQLENRITTNWQKRQEQETLQQQLNAVAQEFPEYVNPLTGQVDVEHLERDLKAYTSKKTITDLIREYKGIKPKGEDPLKQSLSAIERNADRPQSVAASAEAPEKEKKPVPKKLKELHDKFGDLELPPNFDGLVD